MSTRKRTVRSSKAGEPAAKRAKVCVLSFSFVVCSVSAVWPYCLFDLMSGVLLILFDAFFKTG